MHSNRKAKCTRMQSLLCSVCAIHIDDVRINATPKDDWLEGYLAQEL